MKRFTLKYRSIYGALLYRTFKTSTARDRCADRLATQGIVVTTGVVIVTFDPTAGAGQDMRSAIRMRSYR